MNFENEFRFDLDGDLNIVKMRIEQNRSRTTMPVNCQNWDDYNEVKSQGAGLILDPFTGSP